MKKILVSSLIAGGLVLSGAAHATLTNSVADCTPADGKTIGDLFGATLPTLNQKHADLALAGTGFTGWLYNGFATKNVFNATNTLTKPSFRTLNGHEECTFNVMNGTSQVGSMVLIPAPQPAAAEPAAAEPAAAEPAAAEPAAAEPAAAEPAAAEPAAAEPAAAEPAAETKNEQPAATTTSPEHEQASPTQ